MTRGLRRSHPMSSYVTSGRYARDCADQERINHKEALNRNDAIRQLAKSDKLEDKILAIMAARDWYGFQVNDHGVLEFGKNHMHEKMCRDQARSIVKFLESGEFPGIYNPGEKDATF